MGYQVVMTVIRTTSLPSRTASALPTGTTMPSSSASTSMTEAPLPAGGNLHAGACRHFLLHVPQYPPRRSAGQRPGQHEHCLGYSRPGAHAERAACHQGGHFQVDRGIKRARYSVLCTIKHPAILVEGGFMSNPQEALLIATERYQNFMASSLAAAVHQYRTALGQQVRRTR